MWLFYVVDLCGRFMWLPLFTCLYVFALLGCLYAVPLCGCLYAIIFMRLSLCGHYLFFVFMWSSFVVTFIWLSLRDGFLWLSLYDWLYAIALCGCLYVVVLTRSIYVFSRSGTVMASTHDYHPVDMTWWWDQFHIREIEEKNKKKKNLTWAPKSTQPKMCTKTKAMGRESSRRNVDHFTHRVLGVIK